MNINKRYANFFYIILIGSQPDQSGDHFDLALSVVLLAFITRVISGQTSNIGADILAKDIDLPAFCFRLYAF